MSEEEIINDLKLEILSYKIVLEEHVNEGNIDAILECESKIEELENKILEIKKSNVDVQTE